MTILIIMENAGVHIAPRKNKITKFSSAVMKEQDSYIVPLESHKNVFAVPTVKVGDSVKEGTLIGKPKDRYGAFVYSPTSGKVAAIVQQMTVHGNLADHVLITADKLNETEHFRPMVDFSRKEMVERLMVSGAVGEDGELCYIKYLRKPNVKNTMLFVSCIDDDPYVNASEVLFRENIKKVIDGALDFAKLIETKKITFIFTANQKTAIKEYKKYVKENKLKEFYIEVYPNLYPMSIVEITRYVSGKTLDASGRFAKGIYIENVFSCKEFFDAVHENKPIVSRMMTINGRGFSRKGNFVVKVGTQISSILEYVGTRELESMDESFKIVYGGSLSGISQETAKVSVDASTKAILLLTSKEFSREKEHPCNYCGKCVDICPAKIMPYKIEEFLLSNDLDFAKYCGIEACTECGACSFVCPAKRYLAQRISDGKKKLKERGDI